MSNVSSGFRPPDSPLIGPSEGQARGPSAGSILYQGHGPNNGDTPNCAVIFRSVLRYAKYSGAFHGA